MPGMHGMEVLKKVKNLYPDIQVIVLTGHGTEKDAEEARRLGGFDFLNKPADIDQLASKIRKAYQVKFCNNDDSLQRGVDEIRRPC